jgi:hypothetical protein
MLRRNDILIGLTRRCSAAASPDPDREGTATMAAFKFSDNPEYDKARLLAYIEERTIPEPNSGCWLWLKACRSGYGVVKLDGEQYAHRLSWRAHHGSIPPGMLICHKCDVRECCNPDHLFLGSYRDNRVDADRKGRTAVKDRHPFRRPEIADKVAGELNSQAKINSETAREIYRASGKYRDIARAYSVSKSLVGVIKAGTSWRRATEGC